MAFDADHDAVVDAIRGAHLGATGWYRANCPFCEERVSKQDRAQSLGLRASTGSFHCFRCDAAGRVRDLPEDLWRPKQYGEPEREGDVYIEKPEGYRPLAEGPAATARCFEGARRYLMRRHVPRETCRAARVGAVRAGYYAGRIVVPVLPLTADRRDRWLGWVARDWTGRARLRYLYPPGMRRGRLLYNHAAILEETDWPVILVEGVFDALPLLGDGVACLGKPTDWQLKLLVAARRPIVVALDGDAAREGYWFAQRLRYEGVNAGSIRLPACTDPNDVPTNWLREEAQRCIEKGDGE